MIATVELVSMVLLKLIEAAPTVIKTIDDVTPLATRLIAVAKGQKVTAEQQAEIETLVDALYAESQEPLPPAQPGDPDYVPPA
jgi:hypothetical protein